MAKAKEVQKAGSRDLAPVANDLFAGYDTAEGFDIGTDDYKIPFLKVLNDLTPEVKNNVEGAVPGKFLNTATKEVYDHLNLIFIKVKSEALAWKPNNEGIAYKMTKQEYDKKEKIFDEKTSKFYDLEGNILEKSMTYFCLNADEPTAFYILPLKSTSYKYGKTLNSKLKFLKCDNKSAPIWAGVWNVCTEKVTGKQNSWFSIGNTPAFCKFVDKEQIEKYILPAIEKFNEMDIDYNQASETTDAAQAKY